jgi:glycosyltransferase involved in cell wall biosynthesis
LKILLVTPYFLDSFAGRISMGSAVMAARQLSRRHEVTVLTTGRDEPVERLSASLTVVSAPGWLVPDPVNYVISPALLWRVARFIRRERPDLVLVSKFMFFTSLSVLVARAMGTPVVLVTDTYPGINWFPRNRAVAAVMWLYARVIGVPLLRAASKVVLLHEGLEDVARRYRLDYEVIHNGPDLAEAEAAEPAADLEKRPGEVWIGYVGRLQSVKGHDFLLRAASVVHARHPGVRTFFVGAAGPRRLEASAGVRFLGFRRDVYSVLKKMDVFCLPSLSEGLPNALMEAMAVGCACVASRVGGVACLVDHEQNGLLVEPGDVSGLTAALERLVTDAALRQGLGRAAQATIARRFGWEEIGRRYEDLFKRVLGEVAPRATAAGLAAADRSSAPKP